jgi:hypothetical protein
MGSAKVCTAKVVPNVMPEIRMTVNSMVGAKHMPGHFLRLLLPH